MIKTKQNRKWKISYGVLERWTLCFSLNKYHKLKVKQWRVGARGRKKRAFFVLFILSEGNFFEICALSQCIVYSIHFQNIHTFTYQKTLLHTLLLLVFKIVESLQRILKFSHRLKTTTKIFKHSLSQRLCIDCYVYAIFNLIEMVMLSPQKQYEQTSSDNFRVFF